MGYYNKTKVIASTSGRPIIGSVVLVTDVEPTERVNGDALVIGDAWWSPATNILSNYLPDDQGVYGWVSVDSQLIIVSDTEPTSRTNGDDLSIGDVWWDPATTTLRNYLPNESGEFSWVGVDGSDDFDGFFTKEETEEKIKEYLTLVGFSEDPDHETGYILNNNIVGEVRARNADQPGREIVIYNGEDILTSRSTAQSYADVWAGFPWDTNAVDADGVPTGPRVLFRGRLGADGNLSAEAVFYGDVKEGTHGMAGRSKFSADYLREMLGIISAVDDDTAGASGIEANEMYYNTTSNKYVLRAE